MAEMFKLRARSGLVRLPPRVTSRLGISDPQFVVAGPDIPDGEEFDLVLGDDRVLDLTRATGEKVVFIPSDSELAEYADLERHTVSSQEFEEVLKKLDSASIANQQRSASA